MGDSVFVCIFICKIHCTCFQCMYLFLSTNGLSLAIVTNWTQKSKNIESDWYFADICPRSRFNDKMRHYFPAIDFTFKSWNSFLMAFFSAHYEYLMIEWIELNERNWSKRIVYWHLNLHFQFQSPRRRRVNFNSFVRFQLDATKTISSAITLEKCISFFCWQKDLFELSSLNFG